MRLSSTKPFRKRFDPKTNREVLLRLNKDKKLTGQLNHMTTPKSLKHGRLTIGVRDGQYFMRLQYDHGLDRDVYAARSRGELLQRLVGHLSTEHSLDRKYDVGFTSTSDLSGADKRTFRSVVDMHNICAGVYCISQEWKAIDAAIEAAGKRA